MTGQPHPADCPLCGSPPLYQEVLSIEERFCNACGRVFAKDASGKVLRVFTTQHDPMRALKRVPLKSLVKKADESDGA